MIARERAASLSYDSAGRGTRERAASAAAVALFHLLLGYAFLTGLGFEPGRGAERALKLFDVPLEAPPPPPPPPPTPPPAPKQAEAPTAAAAPAGRKATASPIVLPPPRVPLKVAPQIIAAERPATGSESAGGAAQSGLGTGSGGAGNGTGGGGTGSGSGGGGAVTRARHVAGAMTGRDYPRAAKRARAGGTVLVRYTVGVDGRPSGCTVTQSSGNEDLDSNTCRLVEQRFRYEPARDADGRVVPDTVNGRHVWWTEPRRKRYPDEWEPEEPSDF